MPEKATVEFWRDIPAIEKSKVFKPDALPEAYIHDAPTQDERYFVPITDTVSSRPLWISPQRNQWCDILMAKRAGLVNRHYHPHEVFAYTISGKWAISSTSGPRRPAISCTRRRARATRWWRTSIRIRCECSSMSRDAHLAASAYDTECRSSRPPGCTS